MSHFRLLTGGDLKGASRSMNLQFDCKCGEGIQLDSEWSSYTCQCGREYFARIMAEMDESAVTAHHAVTGN